MRLTERIGVMSDSLLDAVAQTMQQDRLTRAERNARLRAAEPKRHGRPPLMRALTTARRTKGMTIRTIAGLPVVIGSEVGIPGLTGGTAFVRNPRPV
jgi:hypothetical protein